ncbi:tyrosine-type recombinase/integrase [Janibacter indicus]|uniref:Site-specific recombinase XerC n=1 Tax=Janibacter indicus TaxID=857417 RepID=A0A1W2D6T1_9MICO|nr:site-specific integrase [Janibacter indicus]SMC93237.1 Site-specific recombinase XerC [Janibacter indicus]
MTRAKRDFGTIRKRANGRYQAYYMGPDQAFHRAPSTFETKADAEAWLVGERRLIQDDDWTPTKSRRARVIRATESFGPYAEAWLEYRELKPRTRALYRRQLDRFLLPYFADTSLRDITPAVVRVWHSRLDPTKPTQRAHVYGLLRSILSTAVADEIIQANPCRVRGAGTVKRARRVEPATLDELEILVTEMPEKYQALVLIGAWCGLRFGEMAELRRGDINLVTGQLQVRRGVVRIRGQVTVGSPKSDAGVRDVAIPPHLVPLLEAHLEEHVGSDRDALVFSAVNDPSVQVHPNTLYRHWYRAREKAGRPDLRIHDLRHTGAVLAAQAGATLAELMSRIGHSTPQAALRYQHAARGRDTEIAAALSRLMEERASAPADSEE